MQTDLPLTRLADDRLGRKALATEIATGLVHSFQNNTESIVLGVNGAWGSGKSSFINFIMEEVETQSKMISREIVVLRFNPWMFTGQKELQEIFLHEMLLKLKKNTHFIKAASEKLGDIIGYLKWVKYFHQGAGTLVEDTEEFLKHIKKDKSLVELKEDLDKLLIESAIKIYVTIDDIDRLTPNEIKEIFQLVKLNGNFANTIFILAYDQDVVHAALDAEFGRNGKRYIEKIVQIDYSLPKATKGQILDILSACIDKISEDMEQRQAVLSAFPKLRSEVFTELFASPRDVYRFTNAIKIRLQSIYKQLNIREFFIIEALRLYRHEAYTFVLHSKNQLLGSREARTAAIIGGRAIHSAVTLIDETSFDDVTKTLLKALFETSNPSVVDKVDQLIKDRRIASPHYFDRYFNLQLSTSDVDEDLYTAFLNPSGDQTRHEILKTVYLNEQLWQFTTFLESKVDAGNVDLRQIIKTTLSFSDTAPYFMEHFNFQAPLLTIKRFCSRLMHNISDLKVKQSILLDHIKQPAETVSFSALSVAESILDAHRIHHDRKLMYGFTWYPIFEGKDEEVEPFISDVLSEFKSGLKAIFTRVLFDLTSLNDHEIIFLLDETLRHEREFFDVEFPELIKNDVSLIRVLSVIVGTSWRSIRGKKSYRLCSQQLYPGMDPAEINNRLDVIDSETLTAGELRTVKFFKNAFIFGLQKDKWYEYETLEEVNGL